MNVKLTVLKCTFLFSFEAVCVLCRVFLQHVDVSEGDEGLCVSRGARLLEELHRFGVVIPCDGRKDFSNLQQGLPALEVPEALKGPNTYFVHDVVYDKLL